MKTLILSPAYGVKANSAKGVLDLWHAGKDFSIRNVGIAGSYCSIYDLEKIKADGFTHVELRYKNDTMLHFMSIAQSLHPKGKCKTCRHYNPSDKSCSADGPQFVLCTTK